MLDKSNMSDVLRDFVRTRLDELGVNPFEAARRGGLERSYFNDILIGKKGSIRDDKKAQVATALEISVSDLWKLPEKSRRVPIMGYAAAGNDTVTFFGDAQGPFDEVPAPDWASKDTVAVKVRGTSLGRFLDGWVAFYDDRRDPPDESLLGQVCVCGLRDGRVVVKKLRAAAGRGLFHLESETEPTMFDVPVDWAAKVREFRQV
jgi:hypothetical protein